jgi:hypothetical protein
MTNQEVMQSALDALGAYMSATDSEEDEKAHSLMAKSFFELKEALAKQEQGEPVAWHVYFGNDHEPNYTVIGEKPNEAKAVIRPLVFGDTTPPQRKPLTDERIKDVANSCMWWVREQDVLDDAIELTRAIEAAHGIKE